MGSEEKEQIRNACNTKIDCATHVWLFSVGLEDQRER